MHKAKIHKYKYIQIQIYTNTQMHKHINVQATTVVFHQFETGLREGTIYTKVLKNTKKVIMETKRKIRVGL